MALLNMGRHPLINIARVDVSIFLVEVVYRDIREWLDRHRTWPLYYQNSPKGG